MCLRGLAASSPRAEACRFPLHWLHPEIWPVKGFGFIGSEEVPKSDVYFKRSDLPQEFRSHPRDQIIGMRAEFAYYLVAQGWARAENLKPVDAATEGGRGDGAGAWGGDAV